jgi:hypothetical protein
MRDGEPNAVELAREIETEQERLLLQAKQNYLAARTNEENIHNDN